MAKKRYSAKKIARTPSLKRKIAELLADYHPGKKDLSLSQMLAYGHRGYISFDEAELCKLFDKLYTSELEKVAEQRKSIEEKKINPRHNWEVDRKERELQSLEDSLKRFKEIVDELFEAQFLV